MQAMRDYVGIANGYIDDVLSGKIPACHWVKAACARQKRDLKNGVPGFRFSTGFATKICGFVEYLRHVKGELAGQRIRLEPWQVFILTTVFGWVDGEKKRRFRHVYIEVPRGNGKSALSSAIALYALAMDCEYGAECYTFATTREQARIVFDVSKRMAEVSRDVSKALGISVQARTVSVMKSGSLLEPKSSEGSTLDGLNTHLAVIDELHAHKTRDLYDVVVTSLGKRRQPLLWVITTAGFDNSGICYELRGIVSMVLDGKLNDESQFGVIYTIDPEDDWTTEAALQKANPNWGVSVMPTELLKQQKTAMKLPSSANNFKTKYLDIWCSAKAAWMDMGAWAKASRDLSLDDFEGRDCLIGLDLGAKNDITAAVLLFPYEENGVQRYHAVPKLYLPEEAIERSKNASYRGWVDDGWITTNEGSMTDFNLIEEDLRGWLGRFNVKAIAYDPWQATQLATSLSNDGAPMVEYRNSVQNISSPMKQLEALVLDGRVTHDGNPVMSWMMGNVVAKLDAKDNIFPRKERYENKIDGAVALIYATAMTMSIEDQERNPFEGIEGLQELSFIEW